MNSLNRLLRRSVILPYTPKELQNPQQPTLAGPRVYRTGDVNFLFCFVLFCLGEGGSFVFPHPEAILNSTSSAVVVFPHRESFHAHSEPQSSEVVPVFRFRLALQRLARITQTAAGHHNKPGELSLPASDNLSPGLGLP